MADQPLSEATTGPDKAGPSKLTAGQVRKRWEEGSRALDRERKWYWEHLSFLMGFQWIRWDQYKGSLIDINAQPYRTQRRLRFTSNRIGPNFNTLLAKLTKRSLDFEVLASSADDSTVTGSRLAERVLRACHYEQRWEDYRLANLTATYLGGTSAISVEWDPSAGDHLENDPVTNKIVGTGDIALTALPITDFTLEPDVRDSKMARWWIRAIAMPPKVAQERYQLAEKPKADLGPAATPLQETLFANVGRPNQDVTLVLTYFERPNQDNPKGQVATVIGEKFVSGPTPWPFPFKHLNLAVFRQTHIPGRWPGYTVMRDAVPVQVAYNQARSVIEEHLKLAGNARLMIPDSSMDLIDTLTDEPGEIVPYNAQAGNPMYLVPPALPRWVILEADKLSSEIDDIMAVHPVSRGVGGADTSGVALSLLAEKDDTPLGLIARDQAEGWSKVATMVLKILADKATETRKGKAPPDKQGVMPSNFEWDGKMLKDQTDVQVPMDSVLPYSKVGAQALALQMVQFGILPPTPRAFATLADLGEADFMTEIVDADVGKAIRENEMILAGKPVIPAMFDDHGQHIAEHNRARKGAAYEYADQTTRGLFDLHVQAHQKLAEEQAQQQMALEQQQPGTASVPQATEPPGSMVPPDSVEAMHAHKLGAGSPGAAPQPPGPGAPTPKGGPPGGPPPGLGGSGGGVPRMPGPG